MARMRTLTQHVKIVSIDLGTLTTGASATYVDTQGYRGAAVLYNITTAGGATFDSKVQKCATSGGSYSDITGAAIVQVPASQTRAAPSVNIWLDKHLQFLKLAHTVTGTVTGSVLVLLFDPIQMPVSQTIAAVETT